MKKLHFLTSGIPLSVSGQKSMLDGLQRIQELGLDGMEMAFVRGIHGKPQYYAEVGQKARNLQLILTAHAPYYINLNAKDEDKLYRSIQHILNSARILHLAGGWSLVFHAGYYLKQDKNLVKENIRLQIEKLKKKLTAEKIPFFIRPELMGKHSQFGSLDEILLLCKETDLLPCIDFSHLHARSGGNFKDYSGFAKVFKSIEQILGENALKKMHIHFSGIEYDQHGEKRHILLKKSELEYKEFAKALKDFEIHGVLVGESPNVEGDVLMMKKIYESL